MYQTIYQTYLKTISSSENVNRKRRYYHHINGEEVNENN